MTDMGSIEGSIEATAGDPGATDYGNIDAGAASNIDAMSFTLDVAGLGLSLASMMGAAAVAGDVPGVATTAVVGGAALGGFLALTGEAMVGFAQSGAPNVMADYPQASLGLYAYTSDPLVDTYGSVGSDGTWTPPVWNSDFAGNS